MRAFELTGLLTDRVGEGDAFELTCNVKSAWCAVGPSDGRDSTTVRLPALVLVLLTVTLGAMRVPPGLAADPM